MDSVLLVIRSVSGVLRAQSRVVNLCLRGGGGKAAGRTPIHFTNLLWVRSTSGTDFITNLSRQQPLFSL